MNVSMVATPGAGDAGGNASVSGNRNDGEGFGLAVKDAEQQHGGKTRAANTAARRQADADGKDAAAAGDDASAPKDDDADPPGGMTATGDILGRILGASILSSYGQAAAASGVEPTGGSEAGGEPASDERAERLIISTVADLAGSPAENQQKRVALSVTSMETHFEPGQNAPKLVDAALPRAKSGGAASMLDPAFVGVAETAGGEAVKAPFAEILQRLDAGRQEKSGIEGTTDPTGAGGDARDETNGQTPSSRSAAARQGDNRRQNEGSRSWTTASAGVETSRASNAAGGSQSSGQIISAQLAERIIGAFADQPSAAAEEPAAASQPANAQVLRMTAGGAALKTLSIQLEPQDLGRVDVSMRLVDGRLTVELAASEASTAATLAGDRHGLRKILEHAGFALDDAAITIVARDAGAPPSSPSTPGGDAGAGRQAGSQDQGFGNSGRRDDADRQASGERRRPSPEPRSDEPAAGSARRNGSIYL